MLQEQFWKEFWRLKVHAKYVDLYLAQTDTSDRAIKVFLAISSSASIGGWVIWKEFSVTWAAIIAGSQALNAIRQYLPYKDRLRALGGLLVDLEEQVIQIVRPEQRLRPA